MIELAAQAEAELWPLVERFALAQPLAGLAIGLVRGGETVLRGFGVRDVRTGAPVTAQTMFHLASVSKPFVATAIGLLAASGLVDLDAPVTGWVPEFTLDDGRADEVTPRRLLSHTSGLPDVVDYGWHAPRLDDRALVDLVWSMAGWRLRSEPGAEFHYSNAGFDLLGLLVSRATGLAFEDATRRLVMAPLGLARTTFRRSEVPADLVASPHVGLPLAVPEDAYPYTRRHAPSSTLHSSVEELCRWLRAHLEGGLDADLRELLWRPVFEVGEPPWQEAAALGWAVGSYRGERMLSHSGLDPGFSARVALLPEARVGVVVLANSNTLPLSSLPRAALDVALGGPGAGTDAFAALPPSGVLPVAEVLAAEGPKAADALFRRVETERPEADTGDGAFEDAVWGAIELHRADLVWPLLRLWTRVRPESGDAWALAGWAHETDGDLAGARASLCRALELDPGHEDAAQRLARLPSRTSPG